MATIQKIRIGLDAESNIIGENKVNNPQMRRKYLIVFAIVAAVCGAGFYGIETFDPCETEIVKTLPSPNGDRNLIVFHRDCGATTDFNTQISLLPSGQRFSFDKFPAFFSVGGLHDLKVKWLSDAEIQISIPESERIYRQSHRAGGVTLIYR